MRKAIAFLFVIQALSGLALAQQIKLGSTGGGGGGFTSDPNFNGAWYPQGFTSGGLGFSVADVAGTATTVIFPDDTATATNGYTLSLGAVAACPAPIPTTIPSTCRYLTWATSGLASQAADTVLMNATGSSAAPAAVAMPTTGTNGCAGSTDKLNYNTSTHAWTCGTDSGGSAITVSNNAMLVIPLQHSWMFASATTFTPTNGVIYCAKTTPRFNQTVSKWAYYITASGDGGNGIDFALYSEALNNLGHVNVTNPGGQPGSLAFSYSLAGGTTYWMCMAKEGGAAVFKSLLDSTTTSTTFNADGALQIVTMTGTIGGTGASYALPATISAPVAANVTFPYMALR